MNTINITPVVVAFNTTANAVSFQVLTLNLTPTEFKLNARFYNVQEKQTTEVANILFALPLEDYNNWNSDVELENKCLSALGLQKNGI